MIFISGLLFIFCRFSFAQPDWGLQKDGGWIKIYTRAAAVGNIKELRVLCTLNTTTARLLKVIQNVPAYSTWVYSVEKSEILKVIDANHIIYYTQSHLPWPLKDRDLVTNLDIEQEPGMLNVNARSVPGILAVNERYIRVPYSLATWTVTKLSDKKLLVDYTFSVNPGGSVPAWLVNATLTIGPFTSFVKLRQLLNAQQ